MTAQRTIRNRLLGLGAGAIGVGGAVALFPSGRPQSSPAGFTLTDQSAGVWPVRAYGRMRAKLGDSIFDQANLQVPDVARGVLNEGECDDVSVVTIENSSTAGTLRYRVRCNNGHITTVIVAPSTTEAQDRSRPSGGQAKIASDGLGTERRASVNAESQQTPPSHPIPS